MQPLSKSDRSSHIYGRNKDIYIEAAACFNAGEVSESKTHLTALAVLQGHSKPLTDKLSPKTEQIGKSSLSWLVDTTAPATGAFPEVESLQPKEH